jgi:hypothetical protein
MSDVSSSVASPGGSGWVINPAFVPPGAQGAGEIVNDLTTGGTNASLAAQQGVALKALIDALSAEGKLRTGSGAPSNGLGANGEGYMRTDKPFLGALYIKTAGAWALADNSYTVATLPTASATYVGAVATVVDTTYCPTGKDFVCVTYDGGTNYYWRPVDGRWMVLQKADGDTADAGTNADVTISAFNFSLPNRTDMIPPGMRIHIEFHGVFTGTNGAKSIQVKGLAMNGGSNSTLCGMGSSSSTTLSARVENIIHVTAANTGYSNPFTTFTANTTTVVQTTYAGTNWAGLAITFTKNGVSASDTVKGNARSIEFVYPA